MTTPNPIPSGDASTPDPVGRIERFLAAQDDSSGQPDEAAQAGDADPAEANPDGPKDDARAKDTEPQFTTAHLAAYLGVDESDIDVDEEGQPVFKTKIDGKESAAKFADLRKSHQLGVSAENRAREAAEREKAAERKLQEADQAIQARFQDQQRSMQELHQMNAILQDELRGEYQAVPWDDLWQSNPAQARALERKFEQRQARITGVAQQINARAQQAAQQAAQQRAANEQQALANERRRLTDLIPEWKDSTVAEKERKDLLEWIDKSGIDRDGLDLNKASQVALVRRAWKHDTLQQSRPAIENKVRTAPKLVKPGQSSQPGESGDKAILKSLKQQARSTGRTSSKAVMDYLMATGKAG
jgi:hypothetical protein